MKMNEETKSNQEFDPNFAEKFCFEILDSDLDPIEKIKRLSKHPRFGGDLIAEMLEYGSHLENYFEHKCVFSNGEDVENVVHGEIAVFEAIGKCANELDFSKLSSDDRKFVQGAYVASEIARIYFDLYDFLYEGTYEEKYNACSLIIKNCAVYFEDARVMLGNDLVYYRVGQKSKLDKIAEGWKDEPVETVAAETEEPMPKAEEKKKGKLSSFGILTIVCAGIFALLMILAILLKNSVINFIMAGTGIVELIMAFVLSSKKEKMILFTCSECGSKREHHRVYLATTQTEKYFERNPNKTADDSIRFNTGYTHWYMSTYTCTKCGNELKKKTSGGGGSVVQYYSGRVKDTRTPPSEF